MMTLSLLSCSHAQGSATVPTGFVDETIVSGLGLPTGIAFLPDGRLLAVEQVSANIVLVRTNPGRADTVGIVPAVNANASERGLLGIAVDPGWPGRPYIYVHSTSTTGKVRISRFQLGGSLSDPNGLLTFDPASRYDLVSDIPDNAVNHNGGTVRFGPDGKLYVSLGEDATPSAAQDTSSLRGVILRLDVSRLPAGPGSASRALVTPPDNPLVAVGGLNARLIWCWGLRNPFRIQIDPHTGTALIADVGENTWEEVDEAPSAGGLNFGWPHYEGFSTYQSSQPLTGPATPPIYVVDHASTGAAAIISAGIYRHPAGGTRAFPAEYEGNAFVSDYYAGFLRRLVRNGATWSLAAPVAGQPNSDDWGSGFQHVSDYAIGPEGGLWYCAQYTGDVGHSGEIHRLISASTAEVDGRAPRVSFAVPYPLPSRGSVAFEWSLAAAGRVALSILDVHGRKIRQLVAAEEQEPGSFRAIWDGVDAAGRAVRAGVYYARLEVDGRRFERAVPLLR